MKRDVIIFKNGTKDLCQKNDQLKYQKTANILNKLLFLKKLVSILCKKNVHTLFALNLHLH